MTKNIETAGRKNATAEAIAILRKPAGVTVEAIQEATGWSRKPTEGDLERLARAKGRGFELVASIRAKDDAVLYRFVKPAEVAKPAVKAKAGKAAVRASDRKGSPKAKPAAKARKMNAKPTVTASDANANAPAS